MSKTIKSISIRLASAESIYQWSKGEVKKPETFNYRTYKPERDGLFCEKIFGPTKDFECACGKYKKVRYAGTVCERCGVKVTHNKVRRKWLGHIKLACPVAHIWFTKSIPNRFSALLGINAKEIEKIIYYVNFIATNVDEEWLNQRATEIQGSVEAEITKLKSEKNRLRNVQKINIIKAALDSDESLDKDVVQWFVTNSKTSFAEQLIEIKPGSELKDYKNLIGCTVNQDVIDESTSELIITKDTSISEVALEKLVSVVNTIGTPIRFRALTPFEQKSVENIEEKDKISALKVILEKNKLESRKNDEKITALRLALTDFVLGEHLICEHTTEVIGFRHSKFDYPLISKLISLGQYDIEVEERKHKIEEQKRIEEIDNVLKSLYTAVDLIEKSPKGERKLKQLARITDPEKEALDVLRNLLQRENICNLYEAFQLRMGAEAILQILKNLDLESLCHDLEKEYEDCRKQPGRTNLKAQKVLKRLKMVRAFLRKDPKLEYINRPEWMILQVLPVLPPDLRPMVELDGGRFASSDLNDLYRRVINRNNRLHKLINIRAPESILRNEKRMLQEAVDNLIDNGRKGKAAVNTNNRPLKSLSDMLKGKQGRFRQNLLGKRVDYSGRSVIVVGPKLKLHQCGLPKFMALELFKPFVLNRLINPLDPHQNIAKARMMIEKAEDPQVWDALADIIHNHPVLLNRAPTLHRLSIQAFEPVLIEGKAIQIHPLVCNAYNADFDGDQMAVHVPLSTAAQAEARVLMLSTNNLLLPANGNPIVTANQDMVLGIYYMTQAGDEKLLMKEEFEYLGGKGPVEKLTTLGKVLNRDLTEDEKHDLLRRIPSFGTEDEVLIAFGDGKVKLQDFIRLPIQRKVTYTGDENEEPETWDNRLERSKRIGNHLKLLLTTVGCVIFNQTIHDLLNKFNVPLEKQLPYYNYAIKKSHINAIIAESFMQCGQFFTTQLLDGLKDLGFEMACRAGITISISDIVIPPSKKARIQQAQKEVDSYHADQFISAKERNDLILQEWDKTTRDLVRDMRKNFDTLNPIFMMAESGARGKVDQVRQLAALRGLMTSTTGRLLTFPIKSSFREGLSVYEYFISTHGGRKGLVDTALKTSDSGYLTRRLVDVALDMTVREKDCIDSGTGEIIRQKVDVVGKKTKEDIIDPETQEIILKKGKAASAEVENKLQHLLDASENQTEFIDQIIKYFKDATAIVETSSFSKIPYIEFSIKRLGEFTLRRVIKLLIGRVAAETLINPNTQEIIINANEYIDHKACKRLYEAGIDVIKIRSVLTCKTIGGVCSKCYGWDLSNLRPVELGEPIGVVAAQSVGEPGTQLTMRTFHTGGIGGVDVKDITKGLPQVESLFEIRNVKEASPLVEFDGVVTEIIKFVPWRVTIKSEDADGIMEKTYDFLLKNAEKPAVSINKLIERDAPLTGDGSITAEFTGKVTAVYALDRDDTIHRDSTYYQVKITGEDGVEKIFETPHERRQLLIKLGQHVKRGERICDGEFDIRTFHELMGDLETQKLIVNNIGDIYESQNVDTNNRHLEVIVRQMIRHVQITHPGCQKGKWFEGDLVDRGYFNKIKYEAEERGETDLPTGTSLLQGISKSSLSSKSFLAAASFQETTKVLTEAAIEGKTDPLRGLKENVLIGGLIPIGTGRGRAQDLDAHSESIDAIRLQSQLQASQPTEEIKEDLGTLI